MTLRDKSSYHSKFSAITPPPTSLSEASREKTFSPHHHHHTLESLYVNPSTGGCQCGASSTCLTSDSSPSCIMWMHVLVSDTRHTSLCANGLSASLRLRVQLRGDSLISHLAVLFLSRRVIMPEVARAGEEQALFKGRHTSARNRLLLLFAPVGFLFRLYCFLLQLSLGTFDDA